MNSSEIERIKELIQKAELEKAKAQGAKDSIKAEWKKKYGFETVEEAREKLNELNSELEKNEKKKEKLMNEILESQDWDEIEDELEG
jgi:uncharacterized protein YaaR (DUF327 family)